MYYTGVVVITVHKYNTGTWLRPGERRQQTIKRGKKIRFRRRGGSARRRRIKQRRRFAPFHARRPVLSRGSAVTVRRAAGSRVTPPRRCPSSPPSSNRTTRIIAVFTPYAFAHPSPVCDPFPVPFYYYYYYFYFYSTCTAMPPLKKKPTNKQYGRHCLFFFFLLYAPAYACAYPSLAPRTTDVHSIIMKI